jgi:cytochrome c oxidase subunit 2
MPFLLAAFFWGVAIATVLIFAARVWWTSELASAHGQAIDDQLGLTLIIAGIVFLLVHLLLGLFVWRYRERRAAPALYWHDNPKLEVGWTIATAVVFIFLGVQGNRVWAGYFRQSVPSNAVTIEVTAQQFAWNFRYPGPDGRFGRTNPRLIDDSVGNYVGVDPEDKAGNDDLVTQNVVAVPIHRGIVLSLRTKDVTHSFFVPQFRVKQDAVPGLTIPVSFTATKLGEYEIACAELCGMQHHKMRARLHVLSEADFEAWLKARAGS